MTKMLTAEQAARRLGVARNTLYGMVRRGEVRAYRAAKEHTLWFDPAWLTGVKRKHRGHPPLDAEGLRGATYRIDLGRLGSVEAVAEARGVSRQAVSEAISRYDAARL